MSDEIKITEAQGLAYLRGGAGCCPACGSTDISGDSLEVEGDGAWQNVDCVACGARWQDLYGLTGIGDPATGTTLAELPTPRAADVLLPLIRACMGDLERNAARSGHGPDRRLAALKRALAVLEDGADILPAPDDEARLIVYRDGKRFDEHPGELLPGDIVFQDTFADVTGPDKGGDA